MKDVKLNLGEGQVFAFVGKNGTGKSTIIQALETIFKVQGFMQKPITDGKDTAIITYTGTDRRGNPIEIEWEVNEDDTAGKFKAKVIDDGKVKTISNISKIRELMGTYIAISVQEAFSMLKYADSRKKFIDNYILPCLAESDSLRLQGIDDSISSAKNKRTEGNLFHTRTQLNNDLKIISTIIAKSITEEEQKLLDKADKVREQLNNLKKKKNNTLDLLSNANSSKIEDYNERFIKPLEHHWPFEPSEFLTTNEYDVMTDCVSLLKTNTEKLLKRMNSQAEIYKQEIEEMDKTIEKGDTMLRNIEALEVQVSKQEDNKAKAKELAEKIFKIESQIEELRKEKTLIIQNSSLPDELEVDGDTIVFKGMPFDETVSSYTEAQIILLELMMKISGSELINIGDWSIYDSESKKKILDMAEKNNMLMVGQMVTDDETVDMEVIIQ